MAPRHVGFGVTQNEPSSDLENVVADVVGLHAQRIGVLAAVGLDDQTRGGPVKVDSEPLDLLLAARLGQA